MPGLAKALLSKALIDILNFDNILERSSGKYLLVDYIPVDLAERRSDAISFFHQFIL
jgi:hypothetical protein